MRKFVLGFFLGVLTLPVGFLVATWWGCLPAFANTDPS
jgi:hypothetical protein